MTVKNKEKSSIRKKKYYQDNKERIKKRVNKYRAENRDAVNQSKREYYHSEKGTQKRKEYARINKEGIAERSKEYKKQYYQINKTEVDAKNKLWCENNRERTREYYANYRKEHRKKLNRRANELKRKRRKDNVAIRLNDSISAQIRFYLKKSKEGRSWQKLLGYSVQDLKKHLMTTMPKGYSWKDYLCTKLHIDHIIPVSVFNFESYDHIDFKKCWSLDNLQLLPVSENCIKNDRIEKPFQPSLLLTI